MVTKLLFSILKVPSRQIERYSYLALPDKPFLSGGNDSLFAQPIKGWVHRTFPGCV